MTKYRHTDETLLAATDGARSVSEILRRLGITLSGGNHSHITVRLKRLGFDIKELPGQGHYRGQSTGRLKSPDERLKLYDPKGNRQHAYILRRALKSAGIIEQCVECGVSDSYNGKPLRLHVDHVNGIPHDCREDNLRFLCPNCHSQTATFGKRRA